MAIVIKIKATKVTGKTQQEVLDRIRAYSIWSRGDYFSSNGSFLIKRDRDNKNNDMARLYSLEKHNRKVKIIERPVTRGKRKGEVEVSRKVVRESGWVGHYYEIPVAMLDRDGTKQNTRTFKLKLKLK